MAYSKKNMIEFVLLTEQLQSLERDHRKLQTKYNNDMLESNKEIFELQTQMNYLNADMKDTIESQVLKATEEAKKSFTANKLQLEDSIVSLESRLKVSQELLKKEESTARQLLEANANLENQLKIVTELTDKKYEKVLERALVDDNFFKNLLEAQQFETSNTGRVPEGFILIEEKKLKKLESDLVELQTSLEQERNQNEMLMLNVAELEKKQKALMSNFGTHKPLESGKFDSNFFKQGGPLEAQAAFGQESADRLDFKQSSSLSDSKFFEMIGQGGGAEDRFRSNFQFKVEAEKRPSTPPPVLGVWFDVLYIKQGKVAEAPDNQLDVLKAKIEGLEKELSSERNNRVSESRARATSDLKCIMMEETKKELEAKVETLKTESNSRAIHLSVVQEKLEYFKKLFSEMQAKEPKVVELVQYIQSEPLQSTQKPSIDVTAEILRSLKSQQASEQSLADRQKIQALEQEVAGLRARVSEATSDSSLELQLAHLKKLTEQQDLEIRGLRGSNQQLGEELNMLKQAATAEKKQEKNDDSEAEQFFDHKVVNFAPTESLSIEELPQLEAPHPSENQPRTVDSFVGFGTNMPNYKTAEEETVSQQQKKLFGGVAVQRICSYDAERIGVIDFVGAGEVTDEEEVRPVNLLGDFSQLAQPQEVQQMNRPDLFGSALEQPKPNLSSQLMKSGSSNRPILSNISDPKEYEKSLFAEFMGSPGTPQLPLLHDHSSNKASYLEVQQSGRESTHFEFLGSPKKENYDSVTSLDQDKNVELKKTKTSPMQNLRFDIQAIHDEARRENDPVNKFDSTFGSSQIHQKIDTEEGDMYLNVAESGVISSAKSSEQHKLQQMFKVDAAPPKNQENEEDIYQNIEESGVISSAKDHQRDQFNNIFKSNRGHPIPTPMEESQVTSGAKDSDQGKMQAMLHDKPALPLLMHLNSIESHLAKKSETPTSGIARDSIGQSEREKFENKIKFLQGKVKELEYKLTIGDSGVGSSTPFSPFTHKSNRQQQELLNKYSSYLRGNQIERPVSDRNIPRLKVSTSPLPSLPHLFQENNPIPETESTAQNRNSPFNFTKKTTIEIGLDSGSEGTLNQETSRFKTFSHPKNHNFSLFGEPETLERQPSQEDKLLMELMGEPDQEARISNFTKGLVSDISKTIKEVCQHLPDSE